MGDDPEKAKAAGCCLQLSRVSDSLKRSVGINVFNRNYLVRYSLIVSPSSVADRGVYASNRDPE